MSNAGVVSEVKLAANRKNAKRSTGPKDTTRTRLNALKHGLLSRQPVILGESARSFRRFSRMVKQEELKPRTAMESILADRIVCLLWRLKRLERVERDIISGDVERWSTPRSRGRLELPALGAAMVGRLSNRDTFGKLSRYETAIERSLMRMRAEFCKLQEARQAQMTKDEEVMTNQ